MEHGLFGSLSLVSTTGQVIIGVTLFVLFLSIGLNLFIRARYGSLQRELEEHRRPDSPLTHRVLNRIMDDARDARLRHGGDANLQAIVEHRFQSELGGLLLGERFVRAATGLVIIFGLVGTFHGLTMSIGQLVSMVADDPARGIDVADVVTLGLTRALSGMSVAFSSSLFGIGSAVVLTVFGVFFSVTDRRVALMTAIETHLDRILLTPRGDGDSQGAGIAGSAELAQVVADFGHAVAGLEGIVAEFGAALQTFSGTTRDFREFNLHLKDNVQRMSLSFADVSEAVKHHVRTLAEPRR